MRIKESEKAKALLRELVEFAADDFDEGESVNGGDTVDWLSQFRGRVKEFLASCDQ